MKPEKMFRLHDIAGNWTGAVVWGHYVQDGRVYRLDSKGNGQTVASPGLRGCKFEEATSFVDPVQG